ncbi:prolyl oligopeptidase family serine peptidase [Opitutia bacterium ISCC 51]|nr:prolyl oligopeptidase family serine peptidase [Opitutae bacterium ISCC 51]QXD26438.1 prolyl oligopeptidase family serine peptidase [Opitutae bacterium ISCC 52]
MHTSPRINFLRNTALFLCVSLTVTFAAEDDPYLWMEEVESEKALAWAKEISDRTTAEFEAVPEFPAIQEKLLEIYNSKDRIPSPALRGEYIYNFWQDPDHVRGIWRRTSLESFKTEDPDWETVLDIDALAESEGENWVWKGTSFLKPEGRHGMIHLSRGGADAVVSREFDAEKKAFVEDGFYLEEAKSRVSWLNENTLHVGTDFGEGSLTDSGYPRTARIWKRGKPITKASTLFEGSVEDVAVGSYSTHTPGGRYDMVQVSPEFFTGRSYIKLGKELVKLDIPEDAEFEGIFKKRLLVYLRSDWEVGGSTYPQDALLSIDLSAFLQGERTFSILFEPEERVAFNQVTSTKDHLIFSTLDNVRSRLYRAYLSRGLWIKEEIAMPGLGTVSLGSTSETDNSFFFTYTDFRTPSSLYLVEDGGAPQKIKSSPSWFDSSGVDVVQNEATSKDGTKIPYFLVTPEGFEADGNNPTLLYAYGGFEISQKPQYSGSAGTSWLNKGGVYVVANIRGGGEFGPKWHRAAMQEKHQNNFDDLIAVAEDLIARKVTSPDHLGIQGGSQGGLLVSGAFTQRPELFNAVVSAVPLADMKRFNKLLAGASWMAEYGNPDTDDWEYMKLWSPYQNLSPDKEYPKVYYWTNTRDDRVHPAHARKMVARLQEYGKPVYYYENTEGGHGGGANLNQRAYTAALSYAYLWKMLR